MARLLNMCKTIDSIPGLKYKVDGNGNVWGGIDRSCTSCTEIFKEYDKLEWIMKHKYVLVDIEKRIFFKRI